jgi:hypothetical protein
MLVFWDARLVFLATPKAGSTAVEVALESLAALSVQRPTALKHTNLRDYHRFVRPYLESMAGDRFTTVALMRAPLDWLGSWYRFGQKDDLTDPRASTLGLSFDDFVQGWCAPQPPYHADVGSQSAFLMPGEGGSTPDALFRYEDMAAFVAFLEDRLDCEVLLPRVNVSPLADMNLSPATLEAFRSSAAADLALYESLGPDGRASGDRISAAAPAP